MDSALRESVRRRAGNRCEYCGIPQQAVPTAPFHVEHIIAKQHGGKDDLANLALACDRCNLRKGPNLSGIDPQTGNVVPLFNPRGNAWDEHFRLQAAEIVGLTATGRATARLLDMNARRRVELRANLATLGELGL
jgi:hypothetical protein